MTIILQVAVCFAAFLFIGVSATMNALFLSSLGRTSLEVALLAAVSVASDVSKAVLPVLIVRASLMRAWGNVGAAALMLIGVTALSLASGTGFTALMRDAAGATRQAHAERLAAIRQELREIGNRLAGLTSPRAADIIDVELSGLRIDRRWQSSKLCAEPTSASMRQFCTDIFRLQAELAAARERDKWIAARQQKRADLDALQSHGAGTDDDPQALVLSGLFGVAPQLARVVLTSWTAVILELGSLIMVLLAAGPALRGWREPGITEPLAPVPAEIPVHADRHHWQRQRRGTTFGATTDRIGDHGGNGGK